MLGNEFEVEALLQLELAGVHLEDFLPFVQVRELDVYLAVETACPHQGLVQNVGAVGGRKYDDTGVGTEAIHFGKKLVQSVFTLVI